MNSRIRFRKDKLVPSGMQQAIGAMGDVGAIIVGGRGSNLYAQGMRGMGGGLAGPVEDLVNRSTGGALSNVQTQLSQVELALKISTAAAVGGALVAVIAAVLSTRRR
jgi:hypothetical protein